MLSNMEIVLKDNKPSSLHCNEFYQDLAKETPTFLHVLEKWSNEKPDHVALVWYDQGKATTSMTYRQLWASILMHAVEIEKLVKPGQCAVLLFEMGLQFIVHFYACLRVGVIAVPCYPPIPGKEQRGIEVITRVLTNSGAKVVFMSPSLELLKRLRGKWPTIIDGEQLQYRNLHLKLYSQLHAIPADAKWESVLKSPAPSPQAVAFLQYTSGSTGDPKGVIIGQDNFLQNIAAAAYWGRVSADSTDLMTGRKDDLVISTSWLPMYHDMGLCIGISTPLLIGGQSNLMSPVDFLRDPLIWLEVLSTSKSTHAIAPNFAFELVCRKWNSQRAKQWDFSTLWSITNAAEPITRSTVEKFTELMKKDVSSFKLPAPTVAYGLAENVVFVGTSVFFEVPIYSRTHRDNVASIPHCKERFPGVRVVSLATSLECADGEEGEVLLQTPGKARGYWLQPDLTKEVFENTLEGREGNWLRTGDLGFFEDGHFFVSGRLKDVIIINGRNYYPQDIELSVQESHAAVHPGCVAAFSIQLGSTEGVGVVAEIRSSFAKDHQSPALLKEVINAIQSQVRSLISRECQQIILIHERTIPKTTSGKIRRKETKLCWEEHRLQEIVRHPKDCSLDAAAPAIDYNTALQWVRPLIAASIEMGNINIDPRLISATSVVDVLEDRSKKVCIRYGVSQQNELLSAQGLDSIKVATLSKEVDAYLPEGNRLETTVYYEWTGAELVLALCGVVPTQPSTVVHPEVLREDDSDIPPLDTKLLQASYSTPFRLFCEMVGVSMMLLTFIAAMLPAVHFFQASKHWDSPSGYWEVDPDHHPNGFYWISTGALMILYAPIFFATFTLLVVLQKWALWGRFQEGFVPMHSAKFYLWWYVDSLLAMWELLVFPFIADTVLVNVVYWMLGGQRISIFANILNPIRNPDLVSIGAHSTIDGCLYTFLVVPQGVTFQPIYVGERCKVRAMSVVHRGSVLETASCVDPCTVVPSFSRCEGGYRWAGNTCRRETTWLAGDCPALTNWILETAWRLVLVGGLIWGSMLGMAISVRLWYVVFPSQPPSQRIGNFWINVWSYYGTGFFWSALTLAAKWFIFGKAQTGPYQPTFTIKLLRWMVSYWNGIALRLVWVHFTHSSLNIWALLLGAKVNMSSQSGWFGCHPVDADLVEIQAHARVARNCVFTPYNSDRSERGNILIQDTAEVGLNCVMDGNTTLEAGARIGVGIYGPSTTTIPSNHLQLNQHMLPFFSPTMTEGDELLRLPVQSDWWYIFNFLSDGSAVLAAWMHLWFAYFVYRSLSVYSTSMWWVLLVTMWIYILVGMLSIVLLNRLFPIMYSASSASWTMRGICYCLWRWTVQYRRLHFDSIGRLLGGTLLYNAMFNMSGSKVSWSAKLLSIIMPDLAYYSIGDMAVMAERSFAFGHLLNNGQLSFGRSDCDSYSCLYPQAMVFAGGRIKTECFVQSNIAVTSSYDFRRSMNQGKHGHHIAGSDEDTLESV